MFREMTIGGKQCRLFGAGKPSYLLIQPSARHESASLEDEVRKTAALSPVPFALLAICLEDWIIDLMPWPDRNISRDAEAGEHAADTLQYILSSAVPELLGRFGSLPLILGGYSLGGLFA